LPICCAASDGTSSAGTALCDEIEGIGGIIRAHGEPKRRWLYGDDLYVAEWTNPNTRAARLLNPDGGVTMVGTVPQ
jgi:hypothetical protein